MWFNFLGNDGSSLFVIDVCYQPACDSVAFWWSQWRTVDQHLLATNQRWTETNDMWACGVDAKKRSTNMVSWSVASCNRKRLSQYGLPLIGRAWFRYVRIHMGPPKDRQFMGPHDDKDLLLDGDQQLFLWSLKPSEKEQDKQPWDAWKLSQTL